MNKEYILRETALYMINTQLDYFCARSMEMFNSKETVDFINEFRKIIIKIIENTPADIIKER